MRIGTWLPFAYMQRRYTLSYWRCTSAYRNGATLEPAALPNSRPVPAPIAAPGPACPVAAPMSAPIAAPNSVPAAALAATVLL